MQYLFNEFF